MNMYFPIALIVVSNIFYHVCAKSSPSRMDPFALLVVAYVMCAIISLIMYFITNQGGNIIREFSYTNWTVIVMGLAIVGLEAGNIFMYRVGWNINTGYLLHSAIFAVALLIVGYLIYKEAITVNKVLGVLACLAGIYFINK